MKQKLTELKEELLFQIKDIFLMAKKKPMQEFNINEIENKVINVLEESMDLFINQLKITRSKNERRR